MKYYEFAKLKLSVSGADSLSSFTEPMKAYETDPFETADISVIFEENDPVMPDNIQIYPNTFYNHFGNSDISGFYSGTDDLGLTNMAVADKYWSNIHITIKDLNSMYPDSSGVRLFNMMSRVVELAMVYKNRMVFHSSSISYQGHGLCFSAASGTGKSTHTSLWKKIHGDDVVIINDDRPTLLFEDGITYLCGTPWAGTSGINTNMIVPLDAVVCIRRGDENKIYPLDEAEAIHRIIKESPRPYTPEMTEAFLDRVNQLVGRTKIYMLECTISEDAVKKAETALLL